MKKVLVSKEWHQNAMKIIEQHEKSQKFVEGLSMFLCTKLTPEQQNDMNESINGWLEDYKIDRDHINYN